MKELTPKGERRRILLVDDDLMQYTCVKAMVSEFHAEQFEVDWAPTYSEGMGSLMSGRYCACFLDYRIGTANGLLLLKEAVARRCTTPIIMLTGTAEGDIDMQALDAGAMDYVAKTDISPRALERALRYAIKLSESMKALHGLATHDDLTGLINRREMERLLADEMERAERFHRFISFVLVDLDHFKQVNDTHGHQVGDLVLRHIAAVLSSQVRSVDSVARYGGEEFAIIEIENDSAGAVLSAERIRAELERRPCVIPELKLTLPITLSAGVSTFPTHGTSAEALLRAADRALYEAKARGRNRVVCADELPPRPA